MRAREIAYIKRDNNRMVRPFAWGLEFIRDHRPHDVLTADATEPAWNGYLLTVACPCGVTFEKWVTPLEAELDLLRAAGLN